MCRYEWHSLIPAGSDHGVATLGASKSPRRPTLPRCALERDAKLTLRSDVAQGLSLQGGCGDHLQIYTIAQHARDLDGRSRLRDALCAPGPPHCSALPTVLAVATTAAANQRLAQALPLGQLLLFPC